MKDQFVTVDGVRIRYRDTGGTGTPILLTHGIGGSLELWNKQLEAVDNSLRLLAWDLPGHGLSEMGQQPYDPNKFAAFSCRFLDALNIQKVALAGNSLGGAISLRIADLQPHRVTGLLLANAAGLGRESPLPFRLMILPILGGMMTRPGKQAIEQQLKALFHDPATITDSIRAVVTRNVHKPEGTKAFIQTLRLMTRFGGQNPQLVQQSRDIIQKLKQPIIFLHGRNDSVIPFTHSIESAKLALNGQLILLDDCGHTPQIEMPEYFNKILVGLAGQGNSQSEGQASASTAASTPIFRSLIDQKIA